MATPRPRAKRQKRTAGALAADGRYKAFAEAYIANGGNGTEAAKAAGYSDATAHSQASRLLRHVKVLSILQQRRAEIAKKLELTTENVLRSLAQAVHFDPRRLYREDGSLKPITELDDDTAAALAGFEVFEEYDGRGEDRKLAGFVKKVKWLDKNTAREQAMKHLGMFKEDNGQRGQVIVSIKDLTGRSD